jgi:hypothetical protein
LSTSRREYEVEPNAPDWRGEIPSDVLLAIRLLQQLAEREERQEEER